MHHVLAVPGKTEVGVAIHQDQASSSFGFCAQKSYRGFSCLACTRTMRDEISSTFGDHQANEIFSIACTRYGRILVRIEATAHQWRISHPPWIFIMNAARRGGRCQTPLLVYSNRSDRSMLLLHSSFRTLLELLLPGRSCRQPRNLAPMITWFILLVPLALLILLATCFEPVVVLPLRPQLFKRTGRNRLLTGKLLGSRSDQQNMGTLQHFPRQHDRILDQFHCCYGPDLQRVPFHDTGVHLDIALSCEAGANARVKIWIIFKRSYGCFYRIKRRASSL